MNTRIEVVNLAEVLTEFGTVERGLGDLRPLWEKFEPEFHQQEADLFQSAPWEPLSEAYEIQKRRHFHGPKPLLRFTDDLFKSLTESKAKGSIRRMDDFTADFGSGDPKAIWHFEGKGYLPVRNPMAEPDVEKYATIAGTYLDQLVREAQI